MNLFPKKVEYPFKCPLFSYKEPQLSPIFNTELMKQTKTAAPLTYKKKIYKSTDMYPVI